MDMDSTSTTRLDPDHPLLAELSALRSSLIKHQSDIRHVSSQLAEAVAQASRATAREKDLAHTNSLLQTELNLLRNAPITPPDTPPLHTYQMTIALRKSSDKYTHIESVLRERLYETEYIKQEAQRAYAERDAALHSAAQSRIREQELLKFQREMEADVILANDERKMIELAIQDYADLVRRLEGRSSQTAPSLEAQDSVSLAAGLAQGRAGLTRLFREHASETELLQSQHAMLQAQLESAQQALDIEKQLNEKYRSEMAEMQTTLESIKADDHSAAMVVSRYMKFSQETTNSLQKALESLRSRHASTVESLEAQLTALHESLRLAYSQNDELQSLLITSQIDVAIEADSRRREVALRLKSASREDMLFESAHRLVNKYRGTWMQLAHPTVEAVSNLFLDLLVHCEDILSRINGQKQSARDSIGALARHWLEHDIRRRLEAEQSKVGSSEISLPSNDTARSVTPDDERGSVTSSAPSTPTRSAPFLFDAVQKDGSSVSSVLEDNSATFPHQPTNGMISTSSSTALSPTIILSANLAQHESLPSRPASTNTSPTISLAANYETKGDSHYPSSLLLSQLQKVASRYDALQRAFHACHLALRKLKSDLITFMPSSSQPGVHPFLSVIERLDDYNEDARVELEIGASDDQRVAHGYEALLSIPQTSGVIGDAVASRKALESEISGFVSDHHPVFQEAQAIFNKKLDDVQHDIAVIQEQLYHRIDEIKESPSVSHSDGSWMTWLNPSSPKIHDRLPMFGTVISAHSSSQNVRANSLEDEATRSHLAHLGLRIATPLERDSSVFHNPLRSLNGAPSHSARTLYSSRVYGLGLRQHRPGTGKISMRHPSFISNDQFLESDSASQAENESDGEGVSHDGEVTDVE